MPLSDARRAELARLIAKMKRSAVLRDVCLPLDDLDALLAEQAALVNIAQGAVRLTHSTGSGEYIAAFDDLQEAVRAYQVAGARDAE